MDNQQTDQVTPDTLKNVPQIASTPKFDIQSAQPLKTIPQLSTNRSARYQRPLTDAERGEATADYFTGKPGAMEKERRAVDSPEVQTGISTLLGGGQEAFGGWTPTAVSAIRGIEANKEKPAKTGDDFKDMMNSLHDNAMRGIFEPESVEPTSVHILNNPHLFGKTNYQTAAAVGTLAEFSAAMITNPLSIIPEGFQALSRERQNQLLFNKITQSPQWGDNITAMAGKSGVPWQKILPSAQRQLWTAINKGNYMQVVLKNMELYQPFKLQGLTTEDVGESLPLPQEDPAFGLKPTVLVKGKEPSIGIDHEDALEKMGLSKDKAVEGKDFQAGFTTPTGEFITREGSKLPPYNLPNGHSEDIPEEKRRQAIGNPQNYKTSQEYVASKISEKYDGKKLSSVPFRKKMDSKEGVLTAAISANGKIYTGKTHAEAIEKAVSKGNASYNEYLGKYVSADGVHGVGDSLFITNSGKLVDRQTASEGRSLFAGGEFVTANKETFVPKDSNRDKWTKEWEEANRLKAAHSALLAPYEVPSPVDPSSLLKKRYDYLNTQADSLNAQHEQLRNQIEQDKKRGFSTGRLEQKLEKVGQKYVAIHNQIVELNIGKVRVNEIKSEVGQAKIEDIIKDVQDAQEKANSEGFKKGVTIGKEKGRIEEVQRKSALEVYANYKQKAVDEMKKIAATLQRIKDSTEGLPIEYKDQLDKILKNFDLSKRTGKTIAERESLRKFIEKAKANGDDIKIPQDVLDAAYQTPLNDLTLTQLRDLNNMVGQIYRMGRLKDKLLEAKGLRDLKAVVDEAVKNITGGKGITFINKFHDDLEKNDPGFFKDLARWAKSHGKTPREYLISNLLPEVQILFLDNLDNGGILYNKLFQPLHEATNTSMDNIDKANKATNDIFNYKKPSDFNKTIPLGNSKIRV